MNIMLIGHCLLRDPIGKELMLELTILIARGMRKESDGWKKEELLWVGKYIRDG